MTKPISDFQKSFLAKAGMKVFTEKEFAGEIERAKDEIMTMAINAAKQAVFIEREECARIAEALANEEDEGETCTAIKNVAEAIRNRLKKK